MGGRGRIQIALALAAALLAGCSTERSAPWVVLPFRADGEAAGSFVTPGWVDRLPALLSALPVGTAEREAYRQLEFPELWRLAYAWDTDESGGQAMAYRLEELSEDRERTRRRFDLRMVWRRDDGHLRFVSAALVPPAGEKPDQEPAESRPHDPITLSPPEAP